MYFSFLKRTLENVQPVYQKRVSARKCAERIAEMRRRMSFVIVTHSPEFARDISTRAIVLERGRAVFSGTAAAAADFYQGMIGRDTVSTVSA